MNVVTVDTCTTATPSPSFSASFIHPIISYSRFSLNINSRFQVDGDTDSSSVQREFEKVVRQQIEKLGGSNLPLSTRTNFNKNGDDYRQNEEMTSYSSGSGGLFRPNGVTKANIQSNDEYIEDLEEHMPGAIPTISRQVSNHMSLANGHIGSTNSGKVTRNRPPGVTNGYVSNGRSNFRSMLEDAEMNSHIWEDEA